MVDRVYILDYIIDIMSESETNNRQVGKLNLPSDFKNKLTQIIGCKANPTSLIEKQEKPKSKWEITDDMSAAVIDVPNMPLTNTQPAINNLFQTYSPNITQHTASNKYNEFINFLLEDHMANYAKLKKSHEEDLMKVRREVAKLRKKQVPEDNSSDELDLDDIKRAEKRGARRIKKRMDK